MNFSENPLENPEKFSFFASLSQDLQRLDKEISSYFLEKSQTLCEISQKLCEIPQNRVFSAKKPASFWPQCRKGHEMLWEVRKTEFSCVLCRENRNKSLWSCEICKEIYCTSCFAPINFENGRCPLQHSLINCKNFFEKCFVCAKGGTFFNGFKDKNCDFYLCADCREGK